MPTSNPSIHYLGVVGATTLWGDHAQCVAQWERIKAERSGEYGPDGAYNEGCCNSHGLRMVGRGWDRDGAANGQQDGVDYNPGSRSMCVLVGTDDEITAQCRQAVADFAEEAFSRGMDRPLRSHSEFVATSCAGDRLRFVIAEFNSGVLNQRPPFDWDAIARLVEELDMKFDAIKLGKGGAGGKLVDDPAHPEVFVTAALDKSHVSLGVLQSMAAEGKLNATPPGRDFIDVGGVKVGLYLQDYLDTFRTVETV